MKFEDLNLSPELLKAIDHLGLTEPTEIQEKSIPLVLARKDVIGESATGSGKTLVFGCGILDQVVPNRGLQALVLVPTRELAEQVKDSLNDFSHNRKLKIIYKLKKVNSSDNFVVLIIKRIRLSRTLLRSAFWIFVNKEFQPITKLSFLLR